MGTASLRTDERFWRMVTRGSDDACWTWRGYTKRDGYGRFTADRRVLAHRFAYEFLVGPIPEGHEIDHLCRNRACVNPAHLQAVTRHQHARRHPVTLRTHCPQGHPYDAQNTYINKASGGRICRTCTRTHQRKYLARKRAVA